jgi:hypothetical protein
MKGTNPYISITKQIHNQYQSYELPNTTEKIYYGHIKDFCDRIKSYLDEKGYNVIIKWRKENSNEYYNLEDSIANWGPFKDYPMANSIHFRIEMINRDVYGDVNESVESTELDLREILLELKDMGYRVTHNDDVLLAVTGESSNVKAILIRDNTNPSDWIELPWSELKEYALRIKDYLGDKFVSFQWRKIGSIGENTYKTIELNDDTQIDDRVWSFAIKYKE